MRMMTLVIETLLIVTCSCYLENLGFTHFRERGVMIDLSLTSQLERTHWKDPSGHEIPVCF